MRLHKLWTGVLLGAFLAVAVLPAGAQLSGQPEKVKSTPITSGAVLHEYIGETNAGKTNFYVIEVDLNNPNVAIGVIPGAGKITQKLNVISMARNNQAVAAVNGDFFNTRAEGSPIGPMVINGELHASPSLLDGIYALGVDRDRAVHIEPFTFSGKVTAANGQSFPLAGLNKTWYWEEPSLEHSHINKLHLYDDLWGGITRGDDEHTVPTEVLVENGLVKDISYGAFFPFAVPQGSYILRGDQAAAEFLLENCMIGEAITIEYQMSPDLSWSQLIGGHALLVENGQAVPYNKDINVLDGARARTAAGMSRDGKTLYIAAAELSPMVSAGCRLEEMASFLAGIGVWKGVNLDGGGSTTMVTRGLGDFQVDETFSPEQRVERPVVNALGVFSLAPAGENKVYFVEGPSLLLLKEAVTYTVKGYDEYYNPVRPKSLQWQENTSLGQLNDGAFTAQMPGTTVIQAVADGMVYEFPVQVLDKSDLAELTLTGDSAVVVPGKAVQLQVMLTTQQAVQRQVPPSLVEWELHGIEGTINAEGLLSITACPGDAVGFVVARYQGFSAPLALSMQSRELALPLAKLDQLTFSVYPDMVGGSLTLQPDPENLSRNVAALQYDFTQGTATMAAYMEFPPDTICLEEATQGFAVDLYGQNGNEWVRAEIIDGNGNLQRLDIASMNWHGWRECVVDTTWVIKPATLKRIYVATTGGTTQRSSAGTVLLKNLTWLKRSDEMGGQATEVILKLGDRQALLNGEPVTMEIAPLVENGRALVPVRFLSELLGATVLWDDETKRCTVIDGRQWIDLWLGEKSMVVNGKQLLLDVPATLSEGRTMLPLRAVAESLKLKVEWEEDTGIIRLQHNP